MAAHREAIQKQIHQDWANREYIEVITASIKRITDFLNSFGASGIFYRCLSSPAPPATYLNLFLLQTCPVDRSWPN